MKTYTIATVGKIKNGHLWFERMAEGVEKFGNDTGHKTFLVGPPKADENLQIQLIENLIDQGVDALCVVPVFPQALEMVLSKARRQGIVVITHEASNQRNMDYDIEAFDNTVFGQHLMDHLAAYMGREGLYAIFLGSLTAASHNEWAKAAVMQQQEHYPEMSLATRKIEHHDDQRLAYEKAVELLASTPDLKGILALGDPAADVAGTLVEEKGFTNDIAVVGIGLVEKRRRNLMNNSINLLSLWEPADAGYVMNKLAVMVLNGEAVTDGINLGVSGYNNVKVEGKMLLGSAMLDVTKDNVSNYTF